MCSTVEIRHCLWEKVVQYRRTPETHDADFHAEEDAMKVRKRSADIMKESQSVRKCVPSRISLVEISLGLIAPVMW